MARLRRICPIGIPQHVIQRGNNKQLCFVQEQDFLAYLKWLTDYSKKHHVDIHAWVLMTNHVHLLVTPHSDNAISLMMQDLGRRYVRYFNKEYLRTGTLWEGRFKSCVVESEVYLLRCYRYIELNPVRASMVERPDDYRWSSYRWSSYRWSSYRWSSYRCNSLGDNSVLTTPHEQYLALGKTTAQRLLSYRALFYGYATEKDTQAIRDAVN